MAEIELGSRIRALRDRRKPHLSRQHLGERMGYRGQSAYQTVYEWETGKRGVAAADIPQLAEALGVSISELYGVAPPDPRIYDDPTLSVAFEDLARAELTAAEKEQIRTYIEFVLARKAAERAKGGAAS